MGQHAGQEELPHPFLFTDGRRVLSPEDWPHRRVELREAILPLEYGGLPESPDAVRGELLHRTRVRPPHDAEFFSYRVVSEVGARTFSFTLTLTAPVGAHRSPVVLTGDACWRYTTEAVTAEVLRRGYVLAQFNRTELAVDTGSSERTSGLYPLFPGADFGALSAWAWGCHRCVDVLAGLDLVDPARIALVGHSRGGKATLLAGATDERISLTCANGSGCGGAGSHRRQGSGAETLTDILRVFPYWFGPRLGEFAGREAALPFDQHFLAALIAPRPLLYTEAFDDRWASPSGAFETYRAAREVYRFLGAEERVGIVLREGTHDHSPADWHAFLDFADAQFERGSPDRSFSPETYPAPST